MNRVIKCTVTAKQLSVFLHLQPPTGKHTVNVELSGRVFIHCSYAARITLGGMVHLISELYEGFSTVKLTDPRYKTIQKGCQPSVNSYKRNLSIFAPPHFPRYEGRNSRSYQATVPYLPKGVDTGEKPWYLPHLTVNPPGNFVVLEFYSNRMYSPGLVCTRLQVHCWTFPFLIFSPVRYGGYKTQPLSANATLCYSFYLCLECSKTTIHFSCRFSFSVSSSCN